MQRSYLVKTPVHFADFGFFVKVGDILVHDMANANKLTVYRNGEVVKAVKQTALGIAAMVKSEFIVEVTQQAPSAKAAPKTPAKAPVAQPQKPAVTPKKEEPKSEPKKGGLTAEEFTPAVKRGKAQPKEIPADEMPERLREALEKFPPTPKVEEE
jgi:hypothetical protein